MGTTRSGDAVVSIPQGLVGEDLVALLDRVPDRTVRPRTVAEGRYDRIAELIVFVQDMNDVKGSLAGLRVVRRFEPQGIVVLASQDGFGQDVLDQLEADPRVVYVEPSFVYRLLQADPSFDKQWGFRQILGSSAETLAQLEPVTVAVIDSGVWAEHPDLDGAMHPVHAGYDYVALDDDPRAKEGHGTNMAGIIAARPDNGIAIAGLAPNAQLIVFRCFRFQYGKWMSAGAAELAMAIHAAADSDARVVNCSWGGPNSNEIILQALQYAQSKNALIVAAAGNATFAPNEILDSDQQPFFPASYELDNVLSVLACDEAGYVRSDSRYGETAVDLGAPFASWTVDVGQDGMTIAKGTSVACAFVSGAAARLLGRPEYAGSTAQQIRDEILSMVEPIPALEGLCASAGRLALDPPAELGEVVADADIEDDFVCAGRLRHPVFALGGETTGTVIHGAAGEIELDLAGRADLVRLAESLDGQDVEVRGTLTEVRGVEIPRRRILTVSALQKKR